MIQRAFGAVLLRACGSLSRALNRLLQGNPNETLCGRMARTRGHWCVFCRLVGAVLRDADHCWRMRISELRRP